MKKSLLLGAALSAACSFAKAATWSVGNATAVPGQQVSISLSLAGDGITEGASIDLAFDEARLTLPVVSGEIPGANVNGQCARSSSKTVSSLIFAVGSVLPAGPQVVCNIPFTVRTTSRSGRIPLRASSKECAALGNQASCVVAEGWIDVLGNPPPMAMKQIAEETDTLMLLLRVQGPSVQELVSRDYREDAAGSPLPGLQHGVLRVRQVKSYLAAGDYLRQLEREPDSPEARSQRKVYVDFDSRESRISGAELLTMDPNVEVVEVFKIEPWGPLDDAPPMKPTGKAAYAKGGAAGSQDFLDVLGITSAWNRAGGWGLVGVLDNGINAVHPQLRSFTGAGSVGGSYVSGGNFLPSMSRNVGGRLQPASNLEEVQPSGAMNAVDEQCDVLDGVNDGWLHYGNAGHGTHVSGLIAANGVDQQGVRGACLRCGIASVKRTWLFCSTLSGTAKVTLGIHPDTDAVGLEHLYKTGAQVVNMSFSNSQTPCYQASNNDICNAIHAAYGNDVLMVASAGNNRETLRFPANDPRVASIGGLGESNAFWDESPGNFTGCPYSSSSTECGSNYAPDTVLRTRQEVMAPAKSVRSTFYPGVTWSPTLGCGDGFGDGPSNDGEGLCTGTSMSAPELAGIYGLLRSINPLMRAGDPVNQTDALYAMPDGIREVVAQTASRSVAGQPESTQMGFGIANADAAARKMLGTVRTIPVRNRVTPLFGMFSPGSNDYTTVATPQLAMGLLLYSTNAYRSAPLVGETFLPGSTITGYFSFPNTNAGTPRARAMVLTTEYRPTPLDLTKPMPVPLVLLEKKRQGPVACDMSHPLCHGDSVVALGSQVQAAANSGYVYGGLQGYVYAKCTPEPACIPSGAQRLRVQCSSGPYADCATFLESEKAAFEGAGYLSNFLGAASSVIGYAYPVADNDGDSLQDGMEHVIGTSAADFDSDDDGLSDAQEYPLTAVPASDPCAGPNITCVLGQHHLFANGFE